MRAITTIFGVIMVASIAGATYAGQAANRPARKPTIQQKSAAMCSCPMCAQMMSSQRGMAGMQGDRSGGMMGGSQNIPGMGGMMGGMMRGPMMGAMPPMTGTAALTVGGDGTIYVLRGDIVYKYSPDLKLLGSTRLPAPMPAPTSPAGTASPPASAPGNNAGPH